MIFRDDMGYLSERSGDGGDSAVRAGLWSIMKDPDNIQFYVKNGRGMRHPLQAPWDNPLNFTKDQLKCLVAGLHAAGRTDLCLEIYNNLKAGYFCPNIERDAVGSVKRPYPHAFYKDSKPDVTTVPLWRKGELDQSKVIETKVFDSADLLLPNDWEFLKVAAGLKKPSGFGLWWHRQALKQHADGDHNEENQMFCECYVLGTLADYQRVNPKWFWRDRAYWLDRDEIEYHEMKVDFLEGAASEPSRP